MVLVGFHPTEIEQNVPHKQRKDDCINVSEGFLGQTASISEGHQGTSMPSDTFGVSTDPWHGIHRSYWTLEKIPDVFYQGSFLRLKYG